MKIETPLHRDERRAATIMAAPALIGLFLFVALPFALAVVLSFTDLRLGSPLPVRWIGLEQYRRVLSDPGFLRALANNALFALWVVPLQTGVALILALVLDRLPRGKAWFRTLFFLPVVFPMALVAVVWTLIYAPGDGGTMNAFLGSVSFGLWRARDFLNDPAWALPAIALLSIWQGVGFQMVILLAGLQSIPASLYEAAAIDGCDRWSRFLYITLPQLRNTLILVVLVTSILAFRLFDQVRIMTGGGPLDATTTVMYEAVTAAFDRQKMAQGAAMTVIFFLIVLAITLIQRFFAGEERTID